MLSSRRDRRESLQQQETGLQVRSSQGRTAEAKIFQKMCVLTGVTNPRWLEQAIGSEDYRRPALCTVTVPDSRVGAARWQWHSFTWSSTAVSFCTVPQTPRGACGSEVQRCAVKVHGQGSASAWCKLTEAARRPQHGLKVSCLEGGDCNTAVWYPKVALL